MILYESIQEALGAEIAVSPKMSKAIYDWNKMYTNEASWLNSDVRSLNLPAAICSEMARCVTMESKIKIDGSSRADLINQSMKHFIEKLPVYVEYACATGGIVFKPYVSNEQVYIDIAKCGSYYPTTFNGAGECTGMIFPEFKRVGKKLYIRLEWHRLIGDVYIVDNLAFMSKKAIVRHDTIANLGQKIKLSDVPEWEGIEPHVEFYGADRMLFSHLTMPMANNVDIESPLGVSVFARAKDQIRDADELYGATLWEYGAKETAIQASSAFFKRDRQGNTIMPKGKERLYHDLGDNVNGKDDLPFFNAYSPDIRDESFFNGYNKIVQKIEFNCGLAYGTLSDPQVVEKTAEEVKASKQRSYSTVHAIQNSTQDAIVNLVRAAEAWMNISRLSTPGNVEISCDWDDSLITDKKSDLQELRADVGMGAVGLVEYRMRRFKETEEQARAALAKLDQGIGGDDD